MKVVQIVRQYPPLVGGLEESVSQLARTLVRDQGCDVRVITLDRGFRTPDIRLPACDVIDGIPVTRIPWRGSSRYPIAPAVLGALGDADIVHVHAIDFFFDFLALTRWRHHKPLVASTHGGFFHTEFAGRAKQVYFRTVTRASARAYRAILASSANDAGNFAAIAPSRVQTVENGVDVEKWRGMASAAPSRTVASIGRFSVNKGLPDLIATVAALHQADPGWRLDIIGQDADLTGDDLASIAAGQGVAGQVTIHRGLDTPAIGAVLGRASYFASASRFEGFGLAAVEGMSAGLIPLLSPIPPFRKLLAGGETGAIISFADPAQAACDIAGFNADQDHRSARAAAMRIAAGYAWPAVGARVAQVYRDMLASR